MVIAIAIAIAIAVITVMVAIIVQGKETLDAAMGIALIAHHTMATAMADGITDTDISTGVSVVAMAVHRASVIETNADNSKNAEKKVSGCALVFGLVNG